MSLLLKVEDVFYVPGRGCVILPDIPEGLDFRIRAREQIELRSPDGRVRQTHIASVEFAKREHGPCRIAIMLPPDITKQDVSTGAEFWL